MDEKGITGSVFRIKRFSIHDGPGIRTAVFLKGCPLSCIWCHSPEGIESRITIWHNPSDCIGCSCCVESCPEQALKLEISSTRNSISIDRNKCSLNGRCVEVCPSGAMQFTGYNISSHEIISEILKDKVFYQSSGGGITISGGEPLFQPEFTREILSQCKSKGINTALETCLYTDRSIIDSVIDFTDLFITDLKIFDSAAHTKYTGKSNEKILENFRYIAGREKRMIARIPMIRGITDNKENVNAIKEFVNKIDNKIEIEMISYNPLAGNSYERLGIPFLIR